MLSVEVISRETIKPSSPTPAHRRSMPISVLDQLYPDIYVPVLFFFRADDGAVDVPAAAKAALLKSSLAETLTHFYSLAGRLPSGQALLRADHAHVDCNDAGVEFYEATVLQDGGSSGHLLLEAVLERPLARELCKLMPDVGPDVKPGDPLLAVQFNAFACGGVALGVCVSHRVADATSLALFLNGWGECSRRLLSGGLMIMSSSPPPRYHAASLFPPLDLPWAPVHGTAAQIIGGSTALLERFVIRGPEIGRLRQETAYAGRTQTPTRVEAVTTLLFRCIIRARRKAADIAAGVGDRSSSSSSGRKKRRTNDDDGFLFFVNLRKRMSDELSDASFGNLITYALVAADDDGSSTTAAEGDGPAGKDPLLLQATLEESMRRAVRGVDADYMREVLEGFLSPRPEDQEEEEADQGDFLDGMMKFSSWCRMSLYRTDFGWGEPAWLCPPTRGMVNEAILEDTKDGLGVEAWVWLPELVMEMLIREPELLEFLDPQSTAYEKQREIPTTIGWVHHDSSTTN